MLGQDEARKIRDNRHSMIHTDYQGPHNWRQYLRHVRSLSPNVTTATGDHGDNQIRTHVDITTTTATTTTTKNNNNNKINTDRSHKESRKQSETTVGEKVRGTIPPWKKDLIEKKNKKKPFNPVNGVNEVFRRRAQVGRESPFTQQVVNSGPLSHGPSNVYRRRFSPSNSFRTPPGSGSSSYRRLLSQNSSTDLTTNSELTRKRIEKVQRARLYLLQLTGPNSFLIGGDSPIHKFKVIIGPQSCSCGRSPHCVHVLFVMLRVFKVKETDPCLWSQTLKNYEVENLFRMYNDRRELLLLNKESSKNTQKKQLEEKPENSPEKLLTRAESDAGSKDDEDTCPICLLEMLEGESLVRCMNGCHNRLHHHCITVWFEECHNQSPLICPICRTKWKSKIEENESGISQGDESSPLIPDDLRLPYAEPVPEEYRDTARPWIQVLGEDLVCCLFSRNWSIREAALKYLSREMVSTLLRGSGEGRTGAMISSSQQTATHQMLECCCSVLAFMCADPVYKVFISCLRTLRALLSYTPCRDQQQKKRLQIILKPVIEAIIIKCTDGNKRTSQLSLSTMVELTKGQDGELAVGREIVSPGSSGLGGLAYILKLVLQEYQVKTVKWQWLLGRLYVLDRLLEEFPAEFIHNTDPDQDICEDQLSPRTPDPPPPSMSHHPTVQCDATTTITTTNTTTSTTTAAATNTTTTAATTADISTTTTATTATTNGAATTTATVTTSADTSLPLTVTTPTSLLSSSSSSSSSTFPCPPSPQSSSAAATTSNTNTTTSSSFSSSSTSTSSTFTSTSTTAPSSSSSSPSSPPSSSPSSPAESQFCWIVIVAKFATYAVANPHSRIAKIARRIFFICVKFSAGQDEIIIQLDNLLVTAVDPKLMRPMRKKLSYMVDKLKLTEEEVLPNNKLRHDSDSSRSTSCVGTSPTVSPSETPLSTPPQSPFQLPPQASSLGSASADCHPLAMTQQQQQQHQEQMLQQQQQQHHQKQQQQQQQQHLQHQQQQQQQQQQQWQHQQQQQQQQQQHQQQQHQKQEQQHHYQHHHEQQQHQQQPHHHQQDSRILNTSIHSVNEHPLSISLTDRQDSGTATYGSGGVCGRIEPYDLQNLSRCSSLNGSQCDSHPECCCADNCARLQNVSVMCSVTLATSDHSGECKVEDICSILACNSTTTTATATTMTTTSSEGSQSCSSNNKQQSLPNLMCTTDVNNCTTDNSSNKDHVIMASSSSSLTPSSTQHQHHNHHDNSSNHTASPCYQPFTPHHHHHDNNSSSSNNLVNTPCTSHHHHNHSSSSSNNLVNTPCTSHHHHDNNSSSSSNKVNTRCTSHHHHENGSCNKYNNSCTSHDHHYYNNSSSSSAHHQHSTPVACNSSHSSSNVLTEDLSDLTISPTGSNGAPVSFKTEIATPKGSPSGTEDQSKPDSYQYCCKEEVEREEAVALAKALEASAKQEPCPLVPGLTPSDREEVITVRIQPASQNEVQSPLNHSSMLSSSMSNSNNNSSSSSSNNNNTPLYLENVHWVRSHLLGTGAFSSCYQARDVKTGTLMAVKQISFCRNTEEEQEKVIQDVTEEIHMIAALNHPNVVRIMGATRQGCHFNMFVEWMPGGSVSNLLAKYGSFSETVVISYTHQVLRGLTYLHENQVLHRDLKGANLLVDSTGQRVRIGDFGAAARLASQSTQAGEFQGQLLGTIAFMAPEVLRGESYGRGCDVWSVGCAMIEMTTTKPPWNANDISNHLALIFRIASSVQPPPIPQKMSPGVRDIMLRCLEVKSEHRPPAKELLTHPVFMQHLNR